MTAPRTPRMRVMTKAEVSVHEVPSAVVAAEKSMVAVGNFYLLSRWHSLEDTQST